MSPIGPAPDPPAWWRSLTSSQRATVLARLKKMGYQVSLWPK